MSSRQNKRNVIGVGIILAVAIVGLAMLSSGPADAERGVDLARMNAAQPPDTAADPFAGSALPSLMRIISALAVVIACIYGGIWALKRLSGKRGGFGRSGNLEVLETTAIAPKKMISLVRVADKAVLVGVTESGISMLTELSPERTAEILAAREAQGEAEGFPNVLKAASGKLRDLGLKRKQAALES